MPAGSFAARGPMSLGGRAALVAGGAVREAASRPAVRQDDIDLVDDLRPPLGSPEAME
jgi:hypothetical protein